MTIPDNGSVPTVVSASRPPRASLDVGGAVPCIYCRNPIAADEFDFWSDGKRLLSAECPSCSRRSTYTTPMWLRWSRAAVVQP